MAVIDFIGDWRLTFRVSTLTLSLLKEFGRKFSVSNNTKNEWENKVL